MKLNKTDREKIRNLFGGRCAYCGEELGQRWHADHVKAVTRISDFVNGKFVHTGRMRRPENDTLDNYYPSCAPCNINKSNHESLDNWRRTLEGKINELNRDSSTYRHAKRFGLVKETGINVVFYFEKFAEN